MYVGKHAILSHFPVVKTPNSNSQSTPLMRSILHHLRLVPVGVPRTIVLLGGQSCKLMENADAKLQLQMISARTRRSRNMFRPFHGAKSALDQNSAGLDYNFRKTCSNLANQQKSNVKYDWYNICRTESCDQNETKISKIESLSSLQ